MVRIRLGVELCLNILFFFFNSFVRPSLQHGQTVASDSKNESKITKLGKRGYNQNWPSKGHEHQSP